jgi:hypothetical protein
MGERGRELAAVIAAMLRGAGTTHDYMTYLKYIGMRPPLLVRNAFTSQAWDTWTLGGGCWKDDVKASQIFRVMRIYDPMQRAPL